MMQHEVRTYAVPKSFEATGYFSQGLDFIGEPGWDRTIDLLIKSQLLYH
jgi:hypothetical protein